MVKCQRKFLNILSNIADSTNYFYGAAVVTQLVEQLRPTPEVNGSNPVINKFKIFMYYQLY